MDLDALRIKLAKTLNENIDIPLINEEWEQIFFERLIDRIWPMIPIQVKWAITSASQFVEPAYFDAIAQSVRLSILPVISNLFWWRDDHLTITDAITNNLMAMTGDGCSVDAYTVPAAVVHDHANETAVGVVVVAEPVTSDPTPVETPPTDQPGTEPTV